jgi:hypothetical protein
VLSAYEAPDEVDEGLLDVYEFTRLAEGEDELDVASVRHACRACTRPNAPEKSRGILRAMMTTEAHAHGPAAMETLAPRSPYEADALGMRRGAFLTGAPYGVFVLVRELYQGEPPVKAVVIAIIMAAFFGTFMGLVASALEARRKPGKLKSQADPAVSPELGDGRYRYRLPCGWVTPADKTVPGVLFVGAADMRFVPHRPAPAGSGEPPVMEPLDRVQINLVELPVTLRDQFQGQLRVPRIELRGPGGTARFRVPEEEAVFRRLQAAIAHLRAEPGSPAN